MQPRLIPSQKRYPTRYGGKKWTGQIAHAATPSHKPDSTHDQRADLNSVEPLLQLGIGASCSRAHGRDLLGAGSDPPAEGRWPVAC